MAKKDKNEKKASTKKAASTLDRYSVTMLLARLFLVSVFVFSLVGKLTNFSGNAAWVGSLGYPMPEVLIGIAILLELVGVVSLVLGYKVKWGVAALVVFTVLTNLMFHVGAGEEVNFLKNLGLIGGLLILAVVNQGKYVFNPKKS